MSEALRKLAAALRQEDARRQDEKRTKCAQIITAAITRLQANATFKDRVDCIVNVTLPAPFNNMELHLVVS